MNAVPEAQEVQSLDEWEYYARLNGRNKLLKKCWYWVAVGPFAAVVFVGLRFFPESSGLFSILVGISLAWALLVAGYCMTVIARLMGIRCPRCGWRFGGGDRCGSCGLNRHATLTYF